MTLFKELSISMRNVLDTFFGSDTDVVSNQVKDILANPEDRQKYLEALKKLKEMEQVGKQGTQTIRLSNEKEITLTT